MSFLKMAVRFLLLATLLAALPILIASTTALDTCGVEEVATQEVNLRLHSKRNDTGKWQTSFVAHTTAQNTIVAEGMVLDLKQTVIKCGGKEVLQVRGILGQESAVVEKPNVPLFFEKGGGNIEFSEDRRTVKRKQETNCCDSPAITNRPLLDNELFEVTLDRILSSVGTNQFMVGLTTKTPTEAIFGNSLLNLKSETLIYYENKIWLNGNTVQTNYGINLLNLKAGERVGVLRKDNGTVHFYVNGVDQGAATTKITGTVYAAVSVHSGAIQATIVNPK